MGCWVGRAAVRAAGQSWQYGTRPAAHGARAAGRGGAGAGAIRAPPAPSGDGGRPRAPCRLGRMGPVQGDAAAATGARARPIHVPGAPPTHLPAHRSCCASHHRGAAERSLGEWDFRDLTLALRPPCLIPRPETEQLVDLVLQGYGSGDSTLPPPQHFLDVGSGRVPPPPPPRPRHCARQLTRDCRSGAICIALLREWPGSRAVAIDVEPECLSLTVRPRAVRCLEPATDRPEPVRAACECPTIRRGQPIASAALMRQFTRRPGGGSPWRVRSDRREPAVYQDS